MNVALLYRYFAGKEAIVGALVERHAEATYEAVRRAIDENEQVPFAEAIRALLQALVTTPSVPALHRELVEQVDLTKRRDALQCLHLRTGALFLELLVHRRRELRPLVDGASTAFVVQHAVEAATHAAAFYRPDELSMERVLEALTELIVRTLTPVRDPTTERSVEREELAAPSLALRDT